MANFDISGVNDDGPMASALLILALLSRLQADADTSAALGHFHC